MALKFTDKFKGLDFGKGKESLTEVTSSVSRFFDRKNREPDTSNVKETAEAGNEVEDVPESSSEGEAKEQTDNILFQKVSQYIAENADKFKQWYSDSKLDEKLCAVAKKVGATLIYPVLLLYNLLKSTETKMGDKYLIIASLAYFILPADVIPDVIVGLGFSDDALALTAALKKLSSSITPALTELTKKQCEEFVGPVDDKLIGNITTQLKDKIEAEESKKHNEKSH